MDEADAATLAALLAEVTPTDAALGHGRLAAGEGELDAEMSVNEVAGALVDRHPGDETHSSMAPARARC